MTKPFSQACENNKDFILDVISRHFGPGDAVLEIASGTAQHACHFAHRLPGVLWTPSEAPGAMAVLRAGLHGETAANLMPPLVLDVRDRPWPLREADGVFSANSLHIMPMAAVEEFFAGAGEILKSAGRLCVYGPFKYGGRFTTSSNEEFDRWLKVRDPASGVRDFEWVDALAREAGLDFVEDNDMPANNQLIVWRKR